MMSEIQGGNSSDNFDMQLIGKLLSFASRGDRVGLNLMLMKGTSPDVQDYDNRTALHLAASEGHAPIIELLLHYNANVNLRDRWQWTPLTDARLYGHRDICRILEVNGGKDFINDHPMSVRHEQDTNEVNFDISELHTQQSSTTEQGVFGESEKFKWRGTWVVKTLIKRQIYEPVKMILSAKDNTLLRELRHPNILQFLGSIEQQEGMILITEYLSKGNLEDILNKRVRLDIPITVRYALDIARGMNYLHEHKPFPIVHYHLSTRNLLQDEGGHLKVGEYWVQMLYERINPEEDNCENCDASNTSSNPVIDTKKDICSFGHIFYQMLEGRAHMQSNMNLESIDFESVDFKPKFHTSRCSIRIKELIEDCTSKKASQRPTFEAVISILEDETVRLGKTACGVC